MSDIGYCHSKAAIYDSLDSLDALKLIQAEVSGFFSTGYCGAPNSMADDS